MKSARISKSICILYLFSYLLLTGGNSFAGNAGFNYIPLAQQQDTITIDTTGSLPFPFEDQPAFGTIPQDSIKLF